MRSAITMPHGISAWRSASSPAWRRCSPTTAPRAACCARSRPERSALGFQQRVEPPEAGLTLDAPQQLERGGAAILAEERLGHAPEFVAELAIVHRIFGMTARIGNREVVAASARDGHHDPHQHPPRKDLVDLLVAMDSDL